jgi:hypothetical protein
LLPIRREEKFWVFAFATQFERAEILVPRFFWNFGFSRFNPDAKLIQVLEADLAITHAIDQLIADSSRETRPGFRSEALLSEYEASQFVPQPFYLVRALRCPKTVCQFEKRLLFLLVGFDSQLNEFDQNAVVAQTPAIRNPFNLSRHGRGKGDQLPSAV